MLWTARAATFLAATSLFFLQPLVARALVPLYGGTSWVWIAVSVFFQLALILGYFAATTVRGRSGLHRRVSAIALVLGAAGFALLRQRLTFDQLPAEFAVFIHLLVTVGAVAMYLAMASPLLQMSLEGDGRIDMHRLYAWSNAGSVVGLIIYPTIMESFVPLRWQMALWLVMASAAAILIHRTIAAAAGASQREPVEWRFPGRGRVAYISGAASALSLAATARLTMDLGALPLLWVLPLLMFLLSYIVAFGSLRLARSLSALAPMALLIACYLFLAGRRLMSPFEMIFLWSGLLFVIECGLQTRLRETAPTGRARGAFYVTLACGGFAGSFIVGWIVPYFWGTATLITTVPFAAPVLKPLLAADPVPEVGWCLIAAAFALVTTERARTRDIITAGLAAAGVLLFMAIEARELRSVGPGLAVVFGALALAYLPTIAGRPGMFPVGVTAIILATTYGLDGTAPELFRTRNVYGVLFARESGDGGFTELYHGTTLHGLQQSSRNGSGEVVPQRPQEALSYYHAGSPVAAVFNAYAAAGCPVNAAIIGLGSGALSAYARPGDAFEFYDIDPAVIAAAEGRHFSFVSAARERGARISILEGDGRRLLAGRTGPKLDLVVVDAFSSDAVPAHLLTLEAFRIAQDQLVPGGYALFHTSNRYFQIDRVVAANAAHLGWDFWVRGIDKSAIGTSATQWVITRPPDVPPRGRCAVTLMEKQPVRAPTTVWTDDFSNPLGILRPQGLLARLRETAPK